MENTEAFCFYCGSCKVRLVYAGKFHRRKKDHGPFDFYVCDECGSGLTLPAPSPAALAELYGSFEFGLSKFTRGLLSDNPAAVWHEACARQLITLSGRARDATFTWVDVGAGGGEIARTLAEHFPRSHGLAIDIHDCPPDLVDGPRNVEWRRIDIARNSFATDLTSRGDLVFAIGVWEHVRRPDIFARNMLAMLNPHGTLYLEAPNYGSLASRLMGQHWPYFLPGEHLCMPTPKGAQLCLLRELANIAGHDGSAVVSTQTILIRYSVRFALAKFSMPWLARLVPASLNAYLPSGAMESIVSLDGGA